MTPELPDHSSSLQDISYPAEEELTPRERDILEWMMRGKTNSEIGIILDISPRTVSKHMERLFTKFRVKSRIAAMVHYLGKIQKESPVQVRDPTPKDVAG